MDRNSFQHKLIFGKNRKIYIYVLLALLIATIGFLFILPNLSLILGACAFATLIYFIVDISNTKRFGAFYAIDVFDNEIIEISDKKGERIVRPEDIDEIVHPTDLNLAGHGQINREENYMYIKLKDGSNLGITGMVSDYQVLVQKLRDYAARYDIKESIKLTGIL